MSSEGLHEAREVLSEETVDMHRGIVSLIEEFEAVDWYQQRADGCGDEELRKILIHHRNEEVEHAIMNLEWLRRRDPVVDEMCRTYLFTQASITEVEEKAEGAGADGAQAPAVAASGSLGIGSLKQACTSVPEED